MSDEHGRAQSGVEFDRRMGDYLRGMREQAMSRRGLLKVAAGTAGAAALATVGQAYITPGVSVLAQDGTTVTFGLESDIRGVEPAIAYDFTANPVVCNITEGVMLIDPQGQLVPLLAETFEQPDPLTYVYTMRSGVTFHDGSPLTVADVLASIERVRAEAIASPMAWMFDSVESIEQTGEMQVTIKLTATSGTFQYVLGTTAGHVMPKALIDTSPEEYIVEPIGTGPYKFVAWETGSQIELEKNAEYWQPGKPYFDKAIFKIVPDGTTRVAGLESGDLTMFREVPPDQLEVLKGMEGVVLQEVVGYSANMIPFVNDKPPFNDPKLRQAVSMAINYDEIMTNLVGDTGVRARASTVPPEMPGSAGDQIEPVAFNLEMAKQAMAESTMPDGFTMTLTVDAENAMRNAEAQAIQQMLNEIGITVEINKIPQPDRITLLQSGDYEGMVFHEWGSDFPDANGMLLPLFHSRNFPPQNNQARYSNPEVDKLLDGAEAEIDPEKHNQFLVDAQKLIAADMPIVWLDHFKWFLPTKGEFTGYTIGPLFYWDSILRDLKPA